MTDFFEDSAHFTGPELDDELVRRAEAELGVRLPNSYVELLYERNGGVPRFRCCPTAFETTWARDHFEIEAILGIGGEWGIAVTTPEGAGSAYMISEWDYPDIGVVVCCTPSGGHDTVMLDYSESGPGGEPAVAYIDEDRVPRRVANSFRDFLARLVPRDADPSG
jgi:SMI1-KNR4 cell-wall